jgi:hypothetical protein
MFPSELQVVGIVFDHEDLRHVRRPASGLMRGER